jgi:hypothetical protein
MGERSILTPPFQGRGQGWVSRAGAQCPQVAYCTDAAGLSKRADARTHPNPSLRREGLIR